MMRSNKVIVCFFLISAMVSVLLAGCYHRPVAVVQQVSVDSIGVDPFDIEAFERTHHYSYNYNFVVTADSLVLMPQMPEEAVSNLPTDSFVVAAHEMLAVAEIRIMPTDSVDSVWVQLAHEQGRFGWIHESALLEGVMPDKPISQFISFFSDIHLLIFLVVFVLILFVYGMRKLYNRKAYMVHFNDIATFYPTLLAIMVALSATLYSTIQLYAPEAWRTFYFHPSLNPFSQSGWLMLFLMSVWGLLIAGIAAVDDVLKHLSFSDAISYLLGLAGICSVNYIIFTVSTMYYVGYLLLAAYVGYALWRYYTHTRSKYICGNCGQLLKKKGHCPNCGAFNE